MEAHRRLHSAESGQLIPRMRPKFEDTASTPTQFCECDGAGDETSDRVVSWPSTDGFRLSPQLFKKAKTISVPRVRPQAALVENRSPAKPCPSAWTSRTQELLDESIARSVSVTESLVSPPSLCSESTFSTAVTSTGPISHENRTSRTVNEGFEILPAGTFNKDQELKALEVWPEHTSDEPKKLSTSKKLKKHRRSSSTSSRESNASTHGRRSGRFTFLHTVY